MAERSANSALWAPIAAGLVGAGLALLFAPRSGQETRNKLKGDFETVKDRADGKLAVAREKVDESLVEAKALKDRLAGAIKKDSATGRGKASRKRTSDDTSKDYSDDQLLTNWEGEV